METPIVRKPRERPPFGGRIQLLEVARTERARAFNKPRAGIMPSTARTRGTPLAPTRGISAPASIFACIEAMPNSGGAMCWRQPTASAGRFLRTVTVGP
jgi:hypothetical protein